MVTGAGRAGARVLWLLGLFSCAPSSSGATFEPGGPTTDVARALLVGAEFPLDDPAWAPSPANAANPGISCVGDACVVVWQSTIATNAARVDAASGTVAGQGGIVVPGSSHVSCTGNDCLLIWQQNVASGQIEIWGARVDGSTGAVLDSTPLVLATGPGSRTPADVSCCQGRCLALWTDDTAMPYTDYGARVDAATGAVLDPGGQPLSTGTYAPSADCAAGGWLVVTSDFRGRHVRADSGAVDGAAFSIASDQARMSAYSSPDVACAGATCLAAWTDSRGPGGINVYGSRFDAAAGTVLDGTDIPISTRWADSPRVACFGASCLVVWEDHTRNQSGDVYGARVDLATGTITDPNGIPIHTGGVSTVVDDVEYPVVACGSEDCLVAWQYRSSLYDVYAGRVDLLTGAVRDPNAIVLSRAPNAEYFPTAACGTDGCLVFWNDNRDPPPSPRVHGVRVNPQSGAVLGDAAVAVTPGAANASRVACGGDTCLLVWEVPIPTGETYESVVAAVRVDRLSGTILDARPTVLAFGVSGAPNVACSGTTCEVVWMEDFVSPPVGTRINLTNGKVSNPGGIAVTNVVGILPAVGCDQGRCLVVWESPQSVGGVRLDLTTGAALDPTPLSIPTVAYPSYLGVACAAGTCFAQFAEAPTGGNWQILGARVDLGGAPAANIDPISIAATAISEYAVLGADVACEPGGCLFIWIDVRNGNRDIFGARIDAVSGQILDPGGVGLFATAGDEAAPALAADGAGRFLLLYTRPDDGNQRVKAQLLELLPPGAACAQAAQCFSGVCVGNQCGRPSLDGGAATDGPTPDAAADESAPDVTPDAGDAPDATPDARADDAPSGDHPPENVAAGDGGRPPPPAPIADGVGAARARHGCDCGIGDAPFSPLPETIAGVAGLVALLLRRLRRRPISA